MGTASRRLRQWEYSLAIALTWALAGGMPVLAAESSGAQIAAPEPVSGPEYFRLRNAAAENAQGEPGTSSGDTDSRVTPAGDTRFFNLRPLTVEEAAAQQQRMPLPQSTSIYDFAQTPRIADIDPAANTLPTAPTFQTDPNASGFPQLPGLRGVRGLSGVLGNMLQMNPHTGMLYYTPQAVAGQGTSLSMLREYAQGNIPIFKSDSDLVTFSTHLTHTGIKSNAILPDTHDAMPTNLWNVWMGINYFHTFDDGKVGGFMADFGSASDKPFANARDISASGTGFMFIPSGDRNAWLLTLTASTNSQVLYNIPIPGAAYLYNPSDDFQAMIGFPFAAINYQATEKIRLQLLYMMLTTVHARTIYQTSKNWQLYAGFDWANENYFRSDRENTNTRFYYYEKRLSAGWLWWWSKNVALELTSGYAFDRYFIEGTGMDALQGINRVSIGSGAFISAQIDVRF